GPNAGDDGDDRDDARPDLRRTISARPRTVGAASRRRLARRALWQAAHAHEGIRRDRALDLGAREAARASGRALSNPVSRPGRDRARQALEEHPSWTTDPDLHRFDRTEERRASRRDRRRLAADLLLTE